VKTHSGARPRTQLARTSSRPSVVLPRVGRPAARARGVAHESVPSAGLRALDSSDERAQPGRASHRSEGHERDRTLRVYVEPRPERHLSECVRYGWAMDSRSTCPTCKGSAAPYPENPAHPFCSKRCKLADLSNWFNERYAVPDEPAPDESNDEPPLLH